MSEVSVPWLFLVLLGLILGLWILILQWEKWSLRRELKEQRNLLLSKDLATFAGLQVYTTAQPEGDDTTVPLDPESEARRWDEAYGVTPQDGMAIANELREL